MIKTNIFASIRLSGDEVLCDCSGTYRNENKIVLSIDSYKLTKQNKDNLLKYVSTIEKEMCLLV